MGLDFPDAVGEIDLGDCVQSYVLDRLDASRRTRITLARFPAA